MTLGVFECVRRSKAKPGVGKPVAISGAAHFFLAFIALSTDNLAVFWTLFARQDRKMVLAGVLILLSLYAVMACLSVLVSRHRISIKGRWLNWLPPTVMIYIGTSMMLQA